MLFSADSVWTMIHGIVLGGGGLMLLAAALFALYAMAPAPGAGAVPRQSRHVASLLVLVAATLWLTVLGGTYIVFPPYRATPPEGLADLSQYPRSFLLANPGTAWLHRYAMETKEHVPWIAAMLATAAAFVGVRHRERLLEHRPIRRIVTGLTVTCFVLAAYVALLGVFVNKVAPLE